MPTLETLDFKDHIRQVPDFPEEGILFYDIAPLIADNFAYHSLIQAMAEPLRDQVDTVAAFDARGFLFLAPLAQELGAKAVMLRKAGKLPGPVDRIEYGLEYGEAALELQKGAITPGERVVLVDDVLATGGTAEAGITLIENQGGVVTEFLSVIELPELGGRERIGQHVAVRSMVSY